MKGEFSVSSPNGCWDYRYLKCALNKARREEKITKYVIVLEIKRDELNTITSCRRL